MSSWIQSYTGRRIELEEPTPDMICIEDIAHALSRICRFTGHCGRHESVAEHSILVALLVSEMIFDSEADRLTAVRQALLHDATEAYLGDVSTPLKQLLPYYSALEDNLWGVIALRFGLPEAVHPLIKTCDIIALQTERRDLLSASEHKWHPNIEAVLPDQRRMQVDVTPNAAKDSFLKCAAMLGLQ